MCVYEEAYDRWECQIETTYRPSQAGGAATGPRYLTEDHMDPGPNRDCWNRVGQIYEPTVKNEVTFGFSLTLGPDENWAAAANNQGTLYANTTITQQATKGKSYIRRWTVVDRSLQRYPYHYVYVPNGMVTAPPNTVNNSTCVASRLGDVRTDAESTNYDIPPVQNAPPPPADPTDDEQQTYRPVCGNMPDRCD